MSEPHVIPAWSRAWCLEDGDRRDGDRRGSARSAEAGSPRDRRNGDRRRHRRAFALALRWTAPAAREDHSQNRFEPAA
jgi:hypothetical protein